jgi:hypothetical protein
MPPGALARVPANVTNAGLSLQCCMHRLAQPSLIDVTATKQPRPEAEHGTYNAEPTFPPHAIIGVLEENEQPVTAELHIDSPAVTLILGWLVGFETGPTKALLDNLSYLPARRYGVLPDVRPKTHTRSHFSVRRCASLHLTPVRALTPLRDP